MVFCFLGYLILRPLCLWLLALVLLAPDWLGDIRLL
jgi:hypothetical protein